MVRLFFFFFSKITSPLKYGKIYTKLEKSWDKIKKKENNVTPDLLSYYSTISKGKKQRNWLLNFLILYVGI